MKKNEEHQNDTKYQPKRLLKSTSQTNYELKKRQSDDRFKS